MRDPTITQRVLAAIDRSDDPHLHIDVLRRELYDQAQEQARQARDIKLLQDAERERLTKTGVWTIVKTKLDEEAVDWMKWLIRALGAGVGGVALTLMGWIVKLALKGMTT